MADNQRSLSSEVWLAPEAASALCYLLTSEPSAVVHTRHRSVLLPKELLCIDRSGTLSGATLLIPGLM